MCSEGSVIVGRRLVVAGEDGGRGIEREKTVSGIDGWV